MASTTIQIAEDQTHEQKERHAEIVGWITIAFVIAGALIGLLGRGPLSHATAETDQIKIEYQKFQRKGASAELAIELQPSSADKQFFWVSNSLLEKIEVSRIEPTPLTSITKDDGVEYSFATQAGSKSKVVFQFQPQSWGRLAATAADSSGRKMDLNMLVYP